MNRPCTYLIEPKHTIWFYVVFNVYATSVSVFPSMCFNTHFQFAHKIKKWKCWTLKYCKIILRLRCFLLKKTIKSGTCGQIRWLKWIHETNIMPYFHHVFRIVFCSRFDWRSFNYIITSSAMVYWHPTGELAPLTVYLVQVLIFALQ